MMKRIKIIVSGTETLDVQSVTVTMDFVTSKIPIDPVSYALDKAHLLAQAFPELSELKGVRVVTMNIKESEHEND